VESGRAGRGYRRGVLQPLTDLVDRPSFQVGLAVGVVATLLLVAFVVVSPRRRPLALAGIGLCAATYVGAHLANVSFPRPGFLALGLIALGAAGAWCERSSIGFVARLALFVPGALLLAPAFVPHDEAFVRPFLIVFVVLAAAAAVEWPRWERVADAGPVLLLLAVGGAYACVPDTEHAALVLGVAIPLACTGWPARFLTLGAGGAAASVGLLAWVAGTDGVARPGAVVGAVACLGVIAFVPLLVRSGLPLGARGTAPDDPGVRPIVAVVGVQLVVVAACSRLAGLEASAVVSTVIAVFALTVGFFALRVLSVPRPRATPGAHG
jgi:hypothetical protein